jgi:hypothetical protein
MVNHNGSGYPNYMMGVCDTQVHPRTTEKGFGEVMNGWKNERGAMFNQQKCFRTATRGLGFPLPIPPSH